MKKFLWLYICCFATLLENNVLAHADSLLYFEQQIFLAETDEARNTFLFEKYLYQKRNLQFNDGLNTLKRILPLNNQTEFNVYYESALLHYITQQFGAFEQDLNYLKQLNYSNKTKADLLEVLLLVQKEKYNEAKNKLEFIAITQNMKVNTDSLFNLKKNKSPNRAEMFSTFLPGTGQWYAGSFKQGALNATLILSLLGWGTYNFLNAYYITSLFTGFFVAYTFYDGGIRYAGSLANRFNKKQSIELRNRLLPVLVQLSY
ncbi:MAG: hypothetical protein ACK4K9_05405 [Bacteroidia bacterium]